MSNFFKALEQTERERALREQARWKEAGPEGGPGTPASPEKNTPPLETRAVAESAAPSVGAPQPDARLAQARSAPNREAAGDSPDGVEEHLVSLLSPSSFEAEQFRTLRHVVEQMHRTRDLRILAISSPVAGDGKTTTAINLAGALAQAPEARVLLVEADLRRPAVTLGDRLGLGDLGGFSLVDAILDPGITLEDVVRRHPRFNLSVLLAGWRPTAPYEALKSPRLGKLLEEARQRYDYILIDTPPLVLVPDCRVIEKWVDGFLMVVAAHKTPRRLVEEALKIVEPAKIVGLVFNNDDRPLSGYYGYYHAYHQPPGDDRGGWRGWAEKKVGGSLRRWRSSRPAGLR